MQCLLHVVTLSATISQKIYTTCYGRFRPNKCDCHLWRWDYRGGWHQSFPPLILQDIYSWQKRMRMHTHLGFPYRTFVHCKVFAPAAPRRARVSVLVLFSGLPLSWPLLILGLVSHYLTNYLISRRPILWHCFSEKEHSSTNLLFGFTLSFPRLSQTEGEVIDVLLSILPVSCDPLTCMAKSNPYSSNLPQDQRVLVYLNHDPVLKFTWELGESR